MASLFGVLDVASRGLHVTSQGVRTASQNIANVDTEGYSRQRSVTETERPIPNANGHIGTGARQTGVERITDGLLQRQLVRQGGSAGSLDAQASALSQIEAALNEQGGPGLSAALSNFFDAFDDLASASTPGAPVEREGLRAAAGGILDVLGSLDSQLRAQRRDTNSDIASQVAQVNDLSQRIRQLNQEIINLEVSAPANGLRDQQELLLRELGQFVDIETYADSHGGTTVVLGNGQPLVEGVRVYELDVVADASDPFDAGTFRIQQTGGAVPVDVTGEIGSGSLGGLLRARDTILPAALHSLDTLAYNLAERVNTVHNTGTGLDGSSGDFFAGLPGVENAARDLSLSAPVAASADAIAAGLTSAPSDNRVALELAALRDARLPLVLPGDPPGPASGPTRSLIEHAAALVSDVGQQSQSLQVSSAQQARILENLENRRDEISGVSLDEEATRLIQLQASFQANARVINLVNGLLDDVLGLL